MALADVSPVVIPIAKSQLVFSSEYAIFVVIQHGVHAIRSMTTDDPLVCQTSRAF